MSPAMAQRIQSNIGVIIIKNTVANHEWLHTSAFRSMFDLKNTNNTATCRLRPLGGPWALFSNMRIMAGGQAVIYIYIHIAG